tara:strand:+ start:722 stop:1240 length:519 start_codon:yes stop_codon:yes gene_type:complete
MAINRNNKTRIHPKNSRPNRNIRRAEEGRVSYSIPIRDNISPDLSNHINTMVNTAFHHGMSMRAKEELRNELAVTIPDYIRWSYQFFERQDSVGQSATSTKRDMGLQAYLIDTNRSTRGCSYCSGFLGNCSEPFGGWCIDLTGDFNYGSGSNWYKIYGIKEVKITIYFRFGF